VLSSYSLTKVPNRSSGS